MRAWLEALDRLTSATAGGSTLHTVYETALDAVTAGLGAAKASVLLFDPDGIIRFKAWRGLSDHYRLRTEGHSPWSPDTIAADPVLVPDARRDRRLGELRPTILAEGIRAVGFFPLLRSGHLLGKFMAYYDAPHQFTSTEVMVARLIAGHVAFAIERQRADLLQSRLAAIVDSSNDAVISKDLHGIIQTWNTAAERLFEYTAAEAIGQSITMLIPPESVQEEVEILDRLRRGQRIEHYETVRITRSGRRLDVSLSISPIRNAEGVIIGASKIARDITEQKQARKEYEELLTRERAARAEAETANRAKDTFLATLSHELRTPLNSILGWTQVLGSSPTDPGLLARALDTITRNAKQQTRLIEDLLDLSSILGGRLRLTLQSVDLVAVVSAAVESIRPSAAAKELEILTEFDTSIGSVRGDVDRLQQVFWNLFTNAVKFTPGGGRIQVKVHRVRSRAIVEVRDTGIGIPATVLPVIFERFRQADSSITRLHGGLGLGLAIVRELVEMHRGRVEASSPGAGQGSTFTVALPLTPMYEVDSRDRRSDPVGTTPCNDVKVLLVDDDPDGRELMSVFLERCGAVVTSVESAAAALAAIAHARPDVLISDIAMPGMDGNELIRRVRGLPSGYSLPAVALTAHANPEARIEALRAGYDLYLTKPVDAVELSAVVSRLGRRGAP